MTPPNAKDAQKAENRSPLKRPETPHKRRLVVPQKGFDQNQADDGTNK
jgi:hypothetical protein